MEYLLPEDYEIAKANGIGSKLLYSRFYINGWDKERATTEPLGTYKPRSKFQDDWEEWQEKAKAAGVSRRLFLYRMYAKEQGRPAWTAEESATIPPGQVGKGRRIHSIPQNVYELARQNGINVATLRTRIYTLKWGYHKAATEPVNSKLNWRKQG